MRRSTAVIALVSRRARGETLWLAGWNARWQAYHFVGGHKEQDETFRECIVREITEELGLREGTDYTLDDQCPRRLEFTAMSRSAGVNTLYTMEVFAVTLSPELERTLAECTPDVRWLSMSDIRNGLACDGRAVSETMATVLGRLDPDETAGATSS